MISSCRTQNQSFKLRTSSARSRPTTSRRWTSSTSSTMPSWWSPGSSRPPSTAVSPSSSTCSPAPSRRSPSGASSTSVYASPLCWRSASSSSEPMTSAGSPGSCPRCCFSDRCSLPPPPSRSCTPSSLTRIAPDVGRESLGN